VVSGGGGDPGLLGLGLGGVLAAVQHVDRAIALTR
jgi:hypothetical protein